MEVTTPPPLSPLGHNISQHNPTTRPSVERTVGKSPSLPLPLSLKYSPSLLLASNFDFRQHRQVESLTVKFELFIESRLAPHMIGRALCVTNFITLRSRTCTEEIRVLHRVGSPYDAVDKCFSATRWMTDLASKVNVHSTFENW